MIFWYYLSLCQCLFFIYYFINSLILFKSSEWFSLFIFVYLELTGFELSFIKFGLNEYSKRLPSDLSVLLESENVWEFDTSYA